MQSFDEFAATEATGLLRYATALSGDPDRAADVVQDVLIRVAVRWERIGSMDFPLAYVRRMVTNGWLLERRSWWTRRATLFPPEKLPEQPDEEADLATMQANRSEVQAALALLPKRQRAALVLRYYLGCDDTTIAEHLGCATGTVRSLCSRGTATLRTSLSADTSAVTRTGHR